MTYLKLLDAFFPVLVGFALIFRKDLAWLRPYMPGERSEEWDRHTTMVGPFILGISIAVLLTLPFVVWFFS